MYAELLSKAAEGKGVRVGLIGTGHYNTAILTQSMKVPGLKVVAVADRNRKAAELAYARAGMRSDDIEYCENLTKARRAAERGRSVICSDPLDLLDLDIDIVAEGTGIPEAAAMHAYEAITRGKHVAMVSKEADAVVGPYLKYLASKNGLVYTPVDGDQHGLLIELVTWARLLGLEVLSAGKARDQDFVYDRTTGQVMKGDDTGRVVGGGGVMQLDPALAECLEATTSADRLRHRLLERREALSDLKQVANWDLTELAIAVNGTGLLPDTPTTHYPVAHIVEIPVALCPKEEGGILGSSGSVEVVTCLRGPNEPGLGGGVFVTVWCENEYSREILATKGLITNTQKTSALIFRPYHLCGVETSSSLLRAVLSDVASGTTESRPHIDVVARATRAMRAGEVLGDDHSPDLAGEFHPPTRLVSGEPIAFHMANGQRLARDVASGELITVEKVHRPEHSRLWSLREAQERQFLGT